MLFSPSSLRRLLLAGALLVFGVAEGSSYDEAAERVRKSLELLLPGVIADSVIESPISGLYEVVIGTRIVYVSGDGRYLLEGNIVDLEQRSNLTEPRIREVRLETVNQLGEANMLVYSPPEISYRVTVFTDIDSGHGRKMHREIGDYLARGIEIRYLFIPRAGERSASYRKAVSVWCAADRRGALAAAAKGEKIPEGECENPIKRHMELGEMIGLTGMPVLLLETGEMIPAYVPAEELGAILERAAN